MIVITTFMNKINAGFQGFAHLALRNGTDT